MATVDKHFRIKHGLVVEGQSATVDGNIVLTEASTLADLSGIDLSGLENGKVLVYNSSTSAWTIGDAGSSVAISETPPAAPSAGDTWFDSSTGKTYIYYVDGDSSQWIEMSNLGDNNAITKLADVDISSLADGDILVYDNVSEKWVSTDVTTDQIQEGSTNLYFTNQKALDATASAYDPAGSAATAESNAIATASTDATNKAGAAESNANAYTASVASTIAPGDASTLTSAQAYTDNAINTLGIDGLSDVNTTGVQDGNALVYDLANSQWIPGEGGGSGSYTISATAPSAPEAGDVWFDSTDGKSYIYYDDGDTQQWLEIGSRQPGPTGATGSTGATGAQGEPGRFTTSDTAPENPVDGDVWFNTTNGVTLVYYTDSDSSQWVESGYPLLGYQTVSDLTDTNISSPSDSQVLSYDNATSKWVNETIETNPYNKSTAETGFLALPVGSEAERPVSPAAGYIRFNNETSEPEWYSPEIFQWIKFREIPSVDFAVEYVVVAGGGGSANSTGTSQGGGGAGGYRSSVQGEFSGGGVQAEDPLQLTVGSSYLVTIGAGGSGQSSPATGSNGNDSIFSLISSTGGGGSGGSGNYAAASGGSGGGGGNGYSGSLTAGGAGISTQGFAGGNGAPNGANYSSGGGGGAGAAGQNGNNATRGGTGGNGVQSSISGSALYRAGGGTGGSYTSGIYAGGLGGGGACGDGSGGNNPGSNGEANTGGGAGGSRWLTNGTTSAAGGSGVVIIKYPVERVLNAAAGLSASTVTIGQYKVTTFVGGSGYITFS